MVPCVVRHLPQSVRYSAVVTLYEVIHRVITEGSSYFDDAHVQPQSRPSCGHDLRSCLPVAHTVGVVLLR